MTKSLSKLKEQIARLQKQADSIQSTVIARLKREIAQHGLTAEHLFEAKGVSSVGNGLAASSGFVESKVVRRPPAQKPPKFADENGNTWHGIGKRPTWIHEALATGRTLEQLLVGAKSAAPAESQTAASVKTAPARAKRLKKAPAKKASPKAAGALAKTVSMLKSPNAKKAAEPAKPVRKTPARKTGAVVAKNTSGKKVVKPRPTSSAKAAAQASQLKG